MVYFLSRLEDLLTRDDIPSDAKKLIQQEVNKLNLGFKSEKDWCGPCGAGLCIGCRVLDRRVCIVRL